MNSAGASFSAVTVRYPRLEVPELPSASPNRVWRLLALTGALSLGALALVVFSSRTEVRLAFGLLGFAVSAVGVWVVLTAREALRGKVRIRAGAPLRFASAHFSGPWGFLSALAMIAVGVVHIVAVASPDLAPLVSVGRRVGNPLWPTIVGLGTLAYLLHRGVPAVGVKVDERGVRTRTGLRALELTWDELGAPELVRRQNGLILGLVGRDGNRSTVFPFYFGADPVIVAEVIEYYRTHPEERQLLTEPMRALERVVEFSRAPQGVESPHATRRDRRRFQYRSSSRG